jgi:hypothetical protein
MNTSVLFLMFNRPDTTAQVFESIARAKPQRLFVAADGPRAEREGEAEKCQAVREIISRVDWECEIKTLYRETNLGCKLAVSSAIDWFFSHVEEGIILEDDCLPSDSFFPFCADLLARYRDDERVMMISGNNFQDGTRYGDASYYFSRAPWVWGWATWRRAWRRYDREMKTFPEFVRQNMMSELIPDRHVQNYRWRQFISAYQDLVDTWDYQWIYAVLLNKGLSIVSQSNLVRNIGFAPEATHTDDASSKFANIPTGEVTAVQHPREVFPNEDADRYFYANYLNLNCSQIKNPLERWRKIWRKNYKAQKLLRRFTATLEEISDV